MVMNKISIKGVLYTYQALTPSKYKKHNPESMAHVEKSKKEIIFDKSELSLKVVIHEVTHAFINQCHLGSTSDISLEDFEEVICELMEDHIFDIISVSEEIYRELSKIVKKVPSVRKKALRRRRG